MTRNGYNRLPVAIDIGHQSQGHYHGSNGPSRIVSLSMCFGHAKAIGAVIFENRPSCHDIGHFAYVDKIIIRPCSQIDIDMNPL